MSRLYGQPIHCAYVYPDFEAAIAKFAGGGIGPFFTMDSGGMGIYRGEEHPLQMQIAFFYSGDSCFELIVPTSDQQSAYGEYLRRNPDGGLHHIAYVSEDFDKSLADAAAAGHPLTIVQEFRHPASGEVIEIYCEPDGVDNPILVQFVRPGMFDGWFNAMHAIAASWDGSEPIRDARALMAASRA